MEKNHETSYIYYCPVQRQPFGSLGDLPGICRFLAENENNQLVHPVYAGDEAAVPVTGAEVRAVAPAPVYDASGRIVAINPNGSGNEAIILAAKTNRKMAPVYDATGALVSDPTGTISSATRSEDQANRKIAPVFDATGTIVSDPTGTILNVSNP